MIILLGGSGYIGSAFRKLFEKEKVEYRSLRRAESHYDSPEALAEILKTTHASFLINAAGYTGKPNVDACEDHRGECLFGNAVLPSCILQACREANVPWGHVSSGCIYTGTRADGVGFSELDPPNFSFRSGPCSFYSGSKALGEEVLNQAEQTYIWRLRIPFNHEDSPRNYLTKVVRYERLLDARNSISQVDEFVSACWQSWKKRIPFGIYNMTNSGSITTREVVAAIQKYRNLSKSFHYFESEEEFMRLAAKTPRSNCVLDNSKILSCGIELSHVSDALEWSLRNWR